MPTPAFVPRSRPVTPAMLSRPLPSSRRPRLWAGGAWLFALMAARVLAADSGASLLIRHALELDGVITGFVSRAEGGQATAEVTVEASGHSAPDHKHLGPVRYLPITVETGPNMSKEFFDWITHAMAGDPGPKRGALLTVDANDKVTERLEFTRPELSAVTFPSLGAPGKDATGLVVHFEVQSTNRIDAPNSQLRGIPHHESWSPTSYRLELEGLKFAHLLKVGAPEVDFNWHSKASAAGNAAGLGRARYGNLVLSMPANKDAEAVQAWADDFIVRRTGAGEKTGELTYLSADGKTALLTLYFHGLGIFEFVPGRNADGNELTGQRQASLYCNDVVVKANQAQPAGK